ncbi:MAG: hypothetical protein JST93_14485 [Acidobacteria bacterium]|nr:hypothetical protein [Acidobacteriota bacterium]
MALWDAIQNTTTLNAASWSRVLNKRSADTFLKKSPLVRMIWGDSVNEATTPFDSQWTNTRVVDGGRDEIELRGDAMTVSYVTTQTTSNSNNYAANDFGSAQFDLSHFHVTAQVGVEEMTFIHGDAAKFDYFDRKAQHILDSLFHKLATEFHATGDQARGSLGSWRLAIDVNDNVSTYLGIQRAAAANANLRGIVDSAGTAVTIARLEAAMNSVTANNGMTDLIVCGAANFGVIQSLVESANQYQFTQKDSPWVKWGGRWITVSGVPVALDGYCSATNIGCFDSTSWLVVLNKSGVQASELIRDVTKQSVYALPVDMYAAIVTDMPRVNARLVTN